MEEGWFERLAGSLLEIVSWCSICFSNGLTLGHVQGQRTDVVESEGSPEYMDVEVTGNISQLISC